MINEDHIFLILEIEPKDVSEACKDDNQVNAMKEELSPIEKKNTQILVPSLKHKNIIGIKWLIKKKLNEEVKFVTKKERLV